MTGMKENSSSFPTAAVLHATGGELLAGQKGVVFSGVSIDSRKTGEGELFLAIKGERFNGNDFTFDALSQGAGGVMTDNGLAAEKISDQIPIIKVDSSLRALQALAAFNRQRFPVPLVAVTGSNGKTTTKEMLASILSKKYDVLKNEGNLNNHIGVPLTLLKLHSMHDVAVVEMGMNKEGEIRELAAMASPDIGVITNIGEAHLEGLGTIENISRAKGELLESLGSDAKAILNADDEAVMALGQNAGCRVITFGLHAAADVRATEIEVEWGKGTLFQLTAGDESLPVLLPLYGIHQLYNALAASAAAFALGFDLHHIREGLEEYRPYPGRMEVIHEEGITLINDSYNANPPSVRSALETMVHFNGMRKIAVLGDMLELGEEGEEIHFDLGRFAASKNLDRLYTLGPLAEKIAEGAIEGGMEKNNISSFSDREALIEELIKEVKSGDCLLVKGSRGMQMDEVAAALLASIRPGKGGED